MRPDVEILLLNRNYEYTIIHSVLHYTERGVTGREEIPSCSLTYELTHTNIKESKSFMKHNQINTAGNQR